MAVSMEDVKKLRDLTSAGFMDCKKALAEANGVMKSLTSKQVRLFSQN